MKLTPEEISNGWDEQSLAAYRAERDKVTDIVAGNVVTAFKRGRAPVRIEGVQGYSPFTKSHP